uniref:RING-type domain-containing protein n=1 Tax=Gallus gallus TaxID=9031 RepID=A0A8V0YFT4_CHICK
MDDAGYAMPCLHQFCFGCICQWTQSRPTCPLCNRHKVDHLHQSSAPVSLHCLLLTVPKVSLHSYLLHIDPTDTCTRLQGDTSKTESSAPAQRSRGL